MKVLGSMPSDVYDGLRLRILQSVYWISKNARRSPQK